MSLAKGLFPRNADVLEEVLVIAFGDLVKRTALTEARDPASDSAAAAADPAAGACLARAANGPGGAERLVKGQDGLKRAPG